MTKEMNINLQLGDVIEIYDPKNEILNEQTFYIDYIDKNKMILINDQSLETIKLKINENGIIGDGTITKISIKSRSPEKGYARQHNFLPNTCVNIYFGGDLPVIITGEITNLENDMIEIRMVDGDIIYINFDYKGIPEDLPIDLIEIRDKPCVPSHQQEESKLGEERETEDIVIPELTTEKNIVVVSNPIQIQLPIDQVKTQIREFIIKADQIQFDNETLGPIVQFVDVYGKSERYSIESQTNDLLDELLSTIPNSERTNRVLNNIHNMIERFVQLREKFSSFDEYGNIVDFIKHGPEYKPLIKYFNDFNMNLLWLFPVVKNLKKIYSESSIVKEDEEQSDVLNIVLNDDLEKIQMLINNYRANNLPNEQNKYSSLYKELNPFFTPFNDINEENLSEIMIEKNANCDINVLIDNLGDFYSSVFSNNQFNIKRFVIEKYNLGLTKLDATNFKGSQFESIRVKLTQPDELFITSVLTLPDPFIQFSRINLPGTSILSRANLNSIFVNYSQALKKNTNVKIINVDSLNNDMKFDENNFVNDITSYVNNLSEEDKRGFTKQEIYDQFINLIVPKTKVLFELMKKHIHGKMTVVDVVTYLEPFLIYSDDLTFSQYKTITQFIYEQVSEYNKDFIDKSKLFYNLKNFKPSNLIKLSPIQAFPIINILTDKNNMRNNVFDQYDINTDINNSSYSFTNNEIQRKLILKDCGKLYTTSLSIQSIPLKFPNEFTSIFEDDKTQLKTDIRNDSKDDICRGDKSQQRTIAKLYFSRDELLSDNKKQIYFDKKYDTTNYGLLDDYEKEMFTKTPEDFIMFLTNKLKKVLNLSDEDADYLADTLITGYKKVLNGQYAILKTTNEKGITFEHYIRKNNEWILDPNVDKEDGDEGLENLITDSNVLCNLQDKCLSVPEKNGDKCESMEISKMELQENMLKDIINEFDEKYYQSKAEFQENIKKKYDYLYEILKITIKMNNDKMLKYNNQKYKMGYNLENGPSSDISIIVSPFAKYRDLILGQSDVIKKQYDIIKFVKICCRTFTEYGLGPLGKEETPHWLYCIETNTELMPTFKYELASAYINDNSNYNDYMETIIKKIGVLGDDGDKWVDKYSGYTIKYIDFNVEEGYEASGFKVSTRGVLEEDIGNKIISVKQDQRLQLETPEAIMISNVVSALSIAMGINIDYQKEFIINGVTEILRTSLPNEADYKKRIKELSNKPGAKTPMSYDDLYYTSILYYTLGMYLIAIQTSVPSVKTRKTFPGCVRSFGGFPFEGTGDMRSVKYISCICYQIRKNVAKPWYVLKKTKEEYIFNKIVQVLNEYLLKLPDVTRKITEKNDYLLLNPEEEIPQQYNVSNWFEFLPPLRPFKLTNLLNISSEFKSTLLSNLKLGSKKQNEQILVVGSKIIQFSLAIQEKIQDIVKKKDLTLSKMNNEFFLENSCCQEKNNEQTFTIAYFEQQDGGNKIKEYNEIVKNLTNLLEDITSYSKACILYSPINTKNIYPGIKKEIESVTIYDTFIHYCHFNSLLPVPEKLLPLCNSKPTDLVVGDNRNEIIKKLKESGVQYSTESFLRLIQIVSQNNTIYIDINKPLVSPLKKMDAILEEMDLEKNEETIEPSLRKLIAKAIISGMMSHEEGFGFDSDIQKEDVKNLNNFLIKQTELMKSEILEFINSNRGREVTRNKLNNVTNFIKDISNWRSERPDKRGNINNITSHSSIYSFINFLQSFIVNFVKIFPNIILNKVDYKENIIPNYLGLSKNHQKKIKDNISGFYEKLRVFYDVPLLNNILVRIQKSCDNLLFLAKNTPTFITKRDNTGREMKPVFDERTGKFLFEYYFFRVLLEYTYLSDKDEMITREITRKQDVQDLFSVDFLEEVNTGRDVTMDVSIDNRTENNDLLIRGDKKQLKNKVVSLLIEFLLMMESYKDETDISYDDVLDRIFKLKEEEKNIITDRLKFMSDEERDADTILKVNKLGVWSKGLQKGLTTYVKENYDEEREFMEKMMNYEKQAMKKLKNSDYDVTSGGFVLDDFIDEIERDADIEREAYDIEGYTENYMNGEFEGDEVDNYEDFE
uniref:Uncharacterized protein n=1 Tax=viral metagenome TaxID=1070528 RepID=A0A6C0DHL7_9ZZZZ